MLLSFSTTALDSVGGHRTSLEEAVIIRGASSLDGEKFSYQVARVEFGAHGEGAQGVDTSTIYTHHKATVSMKTQKPGTLHAVSLCNIHGLWESEKKLMVG